MTDSLYLDLMERCLTDSIYRTPPFDITSRTFGRDWPTHAHTMIGSMRLANVRACVEGVLKHKVLGDLMECGTWRGGASIMMRAVLKACHVTDRVVWVADSFAGFPSPTIEDSDSLESAESLFVSQETVMENFIRYGLLDHQVQFIPGLFKQTLKQAPVKKLAILRLDSDRYDSTLYCLQCLYPKLFPGGYVIVDDYGAHSGCKRAVNIYRRDHKISEPLQRIDWSGVYWQRGK